MVVFLRVFAWLSALPYVVIALLVFTGSPTWSGVAYVLALGVVLVGLMTLAFPGDPFRRRRGLTRLGAGALVVVAVARIGTVGDGKTMHVVDGDGGSARWVSRLVDESDVAVTSARLLVGIGMLRDDATELPSAMRQEYQRMRREQGELPSPVVATHLFLQRPSGFDLVVVDGASPVRGAVVFLHGSAGNFELPCWQIARAVGSLGVTTACPSTLWAPDWETENGQAIVRKTLALLRARGIHTFVLIGLSAGGYGASLLAPRMKDVFAGLVLVSGADPLAPAAGTPTLVIQGRNDTMVQPVDPSTYATLTGARYVEIDAGHFALLVRSAEVEQEIRAFVETRLE
jgi:pimeloyl-ACP methyl ester carboxylesterase